MSKNQAIPGIILYKDDLNLLSMLGDEDFTIIMRAVVEYAIDGEKPEWINERSSSTKGRRRAFATLASKIDRDQAKYERKVQQTSEAGKKSAQKKANLSSQQQEKTENNSTDVERTSNERGTNRNSNSISNVTQTVTPKSCVTPTISSSSSARAYTHEELTELWSRTWGKQPTEREKEALSRIVAKGYEWGDVQEAMKKAYSNADDNPAGYMLTVLEDWKENGRPKRPRESREDNFLRHSDDERQYTFQASIVNLDIDE